MNIIVLLFILLLAKTGWADVGGVVDIDAIDINNVDRNAGIGRQISYVEDAAGELVFAQIVSLGGGQWTRNSGKLVNLGYSNSAYWFKLPLKNGSGLKQQRLLEIGYSVLDYIEVYLVRGTELIEHYRLGDKLDFSERLIQNRHFLIPLAFEAEVSLDVYLRIKTTSSVQLPLTLWEPDEFYQVDQERMMFHGVYFGIALVMIIYNLFVYLATSEKTYLWYVACISCMALFLASLNSITFQYLWPGATWWNDQSIVFFLNGVVVFGSFFSISFLSIHPISERFLNRLISLLGWSGGLLMVLSLFLPYQTIIRPTLYVAMTACIVLILAGSYRWLKGDMSARYFTVAWFALLLGGIVLALNKFTVLPQNLFTENATQIGSAIEIILLSLALADRLYQEKRKALHAQQEALLLEREARMAQEQTLKVQQEANVLLEQRVQERTTELESLNRRLVELSSTDALTGLKNRGYFEESFNNSYVTAFRYQRPIGLLIIDIDFFKRINDEHGHLVGDECLKMVAANLEQVISRPQDLVARYGGEEFVVLLPDTSEAGAIKVAEKLRSRIEQTPFQLVDQTLFLTTSIGVISLIPEAVDKRNEMFDRADEALYKAKRKGRNRVEVVPH